MMIKPLLITALCAAACAPKADTGLAGCWMEILPAGTPYAQGMNLKADGTAESVGTATLKYSRWETDGERLIVYGESIGNGQTIAFADTLKVLSLRNDTLAVERHGARISFTRCEEAALTPPRKAYEGFEWTELAGAGLRLKAQRNATIRLMADPSIPGIVMVRDGDDAPRVLIRVFDLKNNDINDVKGTLEKSERWDSSQTCKFKQIRSDRDGVRRYALTPDGEYARQVEALMAKEPVPQTCSGWGMGNSGSRYFEIHDAHPDKALFVEIGQDAPLFDENSIELTGDGPQGMSPDVLYTMKGTVTIGHEVRAFMPDNGSDEFWIVDKTGRLETMYDKMTNGLKNGKPVKATLKLEYNGKWDDGFAAEYPGVYFVREIISMGR